ncbi:DUF2529 family protein [Bacillus sp. FJAT-42315]|uniref:DUF2529 family protein n=1 Tax=Bacillus sp. FJAT-42315 TaxID=2014077 RepID=UPI000C24CD85|nr:DUF2529 family protein [Bacillus sp. FJAT-42315]
MLKMFSTQLNGLLQRIADKEAEQIEDGARLLAQAAIGDGTIFIKGFNEMKAVEAEAVFGAEPLVHATPLSSIDEVTETDRLLLVSRFADDEEVLMIAKEFQKKNIPFIAIAGARSTENESLENSADIFIDTKLLKGLLPNEQGERTAFPSSIAALYIFFLLKLTIDEILLDND